MLHARKLYPKTCHSNGIMDFQSKWQREIHATPKSMGGLVVLQFSLSVAMLLGLFVSIYGIVGSLYTIKWILEMWL